jgi:hypothetical protein
LPARTKSLSQPGPQPEDQGPILVPSGKKSTHSGTFALLVSATVAYMCFVFVWRDRSWVEIAALGMQYLVLLPLILKYLGSVRGARN